MVELSIEFIFLMWYCLIELNDRAILCLQLDSKHEAAQAYVDAAHCYKKTSTNGVQWYLALIMFYAIDIVP